MLNVCEASLGSFGLPSAIILCLPKDSSAQMLQNDIADCTFKTADYSLKFSSYISRFLCSTFKPRKPKARCL